MKHHMLLNIVSFFDLLLILLVVYYGFKFLLRIIAPRVVDNAANKIFQEMQDREATKGRRTVRKGDVTIDYSKQKPKQFDRTDGDYIEFEEIDDKK
jgi:cbb3-type cytochrome oxidase subunit 3